ncbi:[FeFe] hydrogenase H-cluster radical SAM maturase HydE [Agathobacter ruminis]|uniref:[FeFe] hydrogenase H-cluster radical SAM maturase HydE n=1 Tax=Agathobacter ruminis TaxID=1712665 RepID=A0A2G3E492_9FIRM|nr:[FeFe] hydrogenase H-cluster radical SAM maturase HydE [Agathobacter ruminis]MDC7301236.1 [FeFe] hydrogenase H-cluster radical SAM maturase HydE [Agathobacter ruminis]PHU38102.1 [FeFe] hydrogenase H-cluster radical SAM maturase HydE [Agathobacter ruminis]
MGLDAKTLLNKLKKEHSLTLDEYRYLLEHRDCESMEIAAGYAKEFQNQYYGNQVYIRGLVEFTNFCRNNCLYCGIRRDNQNCQRYRLNKQEIVDCANEGYDMGFRTIVLQGGEDFAYSDDDICDIIRSIRSAHEDLVVTLSIGERSRESYRRYYDAGARRYLLRHETASPELYAKLHPAELSWEHRMNCLKDLKEIGYQVGAGFMVESPGQTMRDLAMDLKFVEEFKPDMCGIGPFITHQDTPFANEPSGTLETTLFCLSLIRMIYPMVLLPATTALGTIHPRGREMGIMAGANVVMPNLSPASVRKKYALYDNKICTGEEAAECLECLKRRMESIRYQIVTDPGNRAGL